MPSSFSSQTHDLYAQYSRLWKKRFFQRTAGVLVVFFGLVYGSHIAEMDYGTLFSKFQNIADYFVGLFPALRWETLAADVLDWFWGWEYWLKLLWDTVLMAYAGTLLGFLIAFPLCFMAASNLSPSKSVMFVTRRILEVFRTIPEMVFALIFVFAFGIGPFAGILALMFHTAGALGKLFFEVVENVDMKPVSGLEASGANLLQRIRFAVLPQIFAPFLTFSLLRFEINVRASTVLGVVGAGGLGHEMMNAIRQFMYLDIGALLVIILVTVMGMNALMAGVRHWVLKGVQ